MTVQAQWYVSTVERIATQLQDLQFAECVDVGRQVTAHVVIADIKRCKFWKSCPHIAAEWQLPAELLAA